jgi:hypothetical protein
VGDSAAGLGVGEVCGAGADLIRSKRKIIKFSGPGNYTGSVASQIDCGHCLVRHTITTRIFISRTRIFINSID